MVYSCSVRENGDANGAIIGVLGIVFNWDGLAQTIVQNTPLAADEKASTHVMIVDEEGLLLADSSNRQLSNRYRARYFRRCFRVAQRPSPRSSWIARRTA